MASQEPTHHVTYPALELEAFIHIPDSVLDKLESSSPLVRKGAQDFVAIRFGKECNKRYSSPVFADNDYISWRALEVAEIRRGSEPDEAPLLMTAGGEPIDSEY